MSRAGLWTEFLTAARYGAVGVAATAVHVAIVFTLISTSTMAPLLANTIAFLVAFCVSFAGNYRWTFRSPGAPQRAVARFLLISVSAFLANTLLLQLILQNTWLAPRFAAIGSACIVPIISYAGSRLWAFRQAAGMTSMRKK